MKDLSLYIHIPFCNYICLYCAFSTFANKSGKITEYIKALNAEIKIKSSFYKTYIVKSIYFGGGTPGILKSEELGDILKSIKENFNISIDSEISIETNPESISDNKITQYYKLGINRINIGIQTFNEKTLLKICRPYASEIINGAITALSKNKIKNFGADLIIGLPYQTLETFKKDLETLTESKIKHISIYFLSFDTPKINLFIKDTPEENIQIKMYKMACATLRKNGYEHYEVSNFALRRYECRHNLRYWNQKEYLGLGLSAHSYINDYVFENENNFESYLNNPLHIIDSLHIDKDLKKMDYIMLHLRTNKGINLKKYQMIFGIKAKKTLLNSAKKFLNTKSLYLTKEILVPSEKGFLILDYITNQLT